MSHTKKLSAGMAATANRLETLPTVQNTLKNIGYQEELAFLNGSAATAISILQTIQNIEDRDIDSEFVNLALDTCGLVYIVIHQCSENLDGTTVVSRDMRLDAEELEQHLKRAYLFFQKKASGSLARRMNIRKRHEDKEKIAKYREDFRQWMLKFGAGSRGSIHDSLQEIIDRKINEQGQQAIAARKAKENQRMESLGRITADMGSIRINDDNTSHVNSLIPPKQATMPEPMMIPSPPVITISDTHHDTRPIDAGPSILRPEALSGMRDDAEKTHRPDDWYAMRRAEKERWRKSEQDFADLPPATPDDDEPPSHLHQNQQGPEQRRSETPIARPFTPHDSDDAAIDRALQERFPHLSADERRAILLAGKTQLQREKEERRESFNRPKKGKKVNRTNLSDSDEETTLRPGTRPFSGHSHTEPTNPGPFYSDPESYSPSDKGSGRSSSAPNFQGHPPGLSPPYGSMRFENIKNSGISLGGGPVHVRNVNTGNTTTITYNDSMNDKSVRNYYR